MAWWRRSDADLVRDLPELRRIMPYVMRSRTESTVYFEQRLDVGAAERLVGAFNDAHPESRASLFHVILWACRQGMVEFPNLNRFVSGGRHYQRRGIWISYSAKQRLKRGAPLLVLKREFDPQESFVEMVAEARSQLHTTRFGGGANVVDGEARLVLMWPGFVRRLIFGAYRTLERYGMFPKSFVDNDPLYASLFLTDLGSLGMDAAYHHLYEYGNIGVFGVVGRARFEQVPDPDTGVLVRKRLATTKWTFDERVEDGLYCSLAMRYMKKLVEDPVAHGILDGDDLTVTALAGRAAAHPPGEHDDEALEPGTA